MHKVWPTQDGLQKVHSYLYCTHCNIDTFYDVSLPKSLIRPNPQGNHTTFTSPDSSIVRRCSHSSNQKGSEVTTHTHALPERKSTYHRREDSIRVHEKSSHGNNPEAPREAKLTHSLTPSHFHHSQSQVAPRQRRSTARWDVSDRCVGELPPARPSALNSWCMCRHPIDGRRGELLVVRRAAAAAGSSM